MNTSDPDHENKAAARRQTRVAEFNQLSKGRSSFERQRRRSSSSKTAVPRRADQQYVHVVPHADPQSAESPCLTPEGSLSRASSTVSLSSLVRSEALPNPAPDRTRQASVGSIRSTESGRSGHSARSEGLARSEHSVKFDQASDEFHAHAAHRSGGLPFPGFTSPPPSQSGSVNGAASPPDMSQPRLYPTPNGTHRSRKAPAGPSVTFEQPATVPVPQVSADLGRSQPSSRRLRATTLDVPGLTRSKVSPDGRIAKDDVGAKLVVVMVGLPARGKSYITKKLARFLNWQQHDCRIFNVGNTRRKANAKVGPSPRPLPESAEKSPKGDDGDAAGEGEAAEGETTEGETTEGENNEDTQHAGDFFSPDNPETVALREKWAEDTLEELLDYILDGEGSVGILDATNTTVSRRQRVLDIINERSNGRLQVLFLESICTQRHIIESNVRLKLSGPDYRHMDQNKAIQDFLLRLRNYEKAYEPISAGEEADRSFQYVRFINVGQKFECGNIKGFLSGQVVYFLLNFNLQPRQIWITRHGESTDNQLGRIGGDAGLTERGAKYAAALSEFMKFKKQEFQARLIQEEADQLQILRNSGSRPPTPDNEVADQNFCVWTSMLRRTIDTAHHFSDNEFDIKEMRMLNELDPGLCGGMTYEEIKEKYPSEYEARMEDKIRYRYPGLGGESYLDVINRLRPVIVEIERMEDNCLVICHRVVARVLLSYFMNLGRDAIGDLEVPLHTLYVLEPKPYGVDWALYKYNERVNWFYEVSPEDARVQSQLSDKKRRYTVVPTAGMSLGVSEALLEHARAQVEEDGNVFEDSSASDSDNEAADIVAVHETEHCARLEGDSVSSSGNSSNAGSHSGSRSSSRRGSAHIGEAVSDLTTKSF